MNGTHYKKSVLQNDIQKRYNTRDYTGIVNTKNYTGTNTGILDHILPILENITAFTGST